MAAPTFVTSVQSAWSTTTSPKTTPALTAAVGDVIVSFTGDENDDGTENYTWSNTGTAQTWAEQPETTGTSSQDCWAQAATTVVAAGGLSANTISVARTAGTAQLYGVCAAQFTGSGGIGAVAKTSGGVSSVSITTTAANSAIVYALFDWSAADGTSRTHRTVNGYTPTLGNGQEIVYFRDSLKYTIYGAYIPDAGAAGAKTVGISAPTVHGVLVAVEVLAPVVARDVMPVSYSAASSAWVAPASSVTVTPTYPADDNLDLITAWIAAKAATVADVTSNTPAGWTAGPTNRVGDSATPAAGVGPVQGIAFQRVSDGSLSGGSQAFTLGNCSGPLAVMHAWKYNATGFTDPQWSPIIATTHTHVSSTTVGGTGAAGLDLKTGDVLAYLNITADDAATAITLTSLAASGATLSAIARVPDVTVINAQGFDVSAAFGYSLVTAGASNVAPVAVATSNSAETGGGIFFRIRATGVAAGGTAFTVTPTDGAGSTDTAALDESDVVVDGAGATDVNAVDQGIVAVDAAGSTDPAPVVSLFRLTDLTQTDSAGAVDSAAYAFGPGASDLAGSTDSPVLDRITGREDSAGATDVPVVALGRVVTTTDGAGSTDSPVVALSVAVVVSATDAAGSTDSFTAVLAADRAVAATDDAGSADSSLLTRGVGALDAAGSADAAGLTQVKSFVDSSGSTDSPAVAAVYTQAPVDSSGSADTAGQLAIYARPATDLAGTSDPFSIDKGILLNPSDSAGSTDTKLYSRDVGREDSAGSADSAVLTQVKVWALTATDSAGTSDSVAHSAGIGLQSLDDAGTSDAAGLGRGKSYSDVAGTSDGIGLTTGQALTASNDAGTSDSLTILVLRGVNAQDDAGSSDEVGLSFELGIESVDDAGSDEIIDLLWINGGSYRDLHVLGIIETNGVARITQAQRRVSISEVGGTRIEEIPRRVSITEAGATGVRELVP